MGGPDLRGASAESRSNAECSDNGHSGSGRPSEGIRGRPSSFGTHHPEPLLFDVASDFKVGLESWCYRKCEKICVVKCHGVTESVRKFVS
jgi:hypothetical protein